jgi:hypothetical protein
MTLYSYQIGTTYGGLTNVESLSTPVQPPRSTPPDYSQPIPLASGGVRGAGWLRCTWSWDILSQAEYNKLRTFCTGKSASVYINTRKDAGTYQVYTATLVWPEQPRRDSGRVLGLVLEFQDLEEYSP